MGIFLHLFTVFNTLFICRPSDSTVSEDAGVEPRTVATTALAVRSSNHSAKSHPHAAKSHPHSAKSHPHSAKSHPFFLLTLGLEAPAPQQRYRRFSREKKQSLQLTTIFRQNSGLRRCWATPNSTCFHLPYIYRKFMPIPCIVHRVDTKSPVFTVEMGH